MSKVKKSFTGRPGYFFFCYAGDRKRTIFQVGLVSLKSWLHFGFRIKTGGLSPSTFTTTELSSPLQFSGYHNLVRVDPDYLKRKLTAFSYQLSLQRALLDVDRGLGLVKLILVSQEKPSNSIQKLFMTETVSTVIVKSYLVYSRIQSPAII